MTSGLLGWVDLSLSVLSKNFRVMSDQKSVPMGLKFAFGGLSGAGAAFCVQPMDLVKNRMQVSYSHGMSHTK